MKTKNDFTELNYNEYAFFKGVSTTDAKWEFMVHIFKKDWWPKHEEAIKNKVASKYLTKAGNPRITAKDLVSIKDLDFTMRSNSPSMDGKSRFEYLVDYYNKGIPLNSLREFSDKDGFIKAIRFTGKDTVINDILNPDQLIKLQKTWLLRSFEHGILDTAIRFEDANEWASQYLYENGIDMDRFYKAKDRLLNPVESE